MPNSHPERFQKKLTELTKALYTTIDKLPENWESYKVQEKVGEEGSPTEMVINVMIAAKDRDLVIADKKLKKKQAELLEKGLQPKAQAPDTVSVEETKEMIKMEELEHECE